MRIYTTYPLHTLGSQTHTHTQTLAHTHEPNAQNTHLYTSTQAPGAPSLTRLLALHSSVTSMRLIERALRNLRPSALFQWCVNMSAALTSRGTFVIFNSPLASFSCAHSWRTVRCFTRPAPERAQSPWAADASVHNSSWGSSPHCCRRCLTPSPSTPPLMSAFTSD